MNILKIKVRKGPRVPAEESPELRRLLDLIEGNGYGKFAINHLSMADDGDGLAIIADRLLPPTGAAKVRELFGGQSKMECGQTAAKLVDAYESERNEAWAVLAHA